MASGILRRIANHVAFWRRLSALPDDLTRIADRLENMPFEIAAAVKAQTIHWPTVHSKEETLEKLHEERCSICRFGDGEFRLAAGESIEFQNALPDLTSRLREILVSRDDGILVGIPPVFGSLESFVESSRNFWRAYLARRRHNIYQVLDFHSEYWDAFITRPYYAFLDKSSVGKYFQRVRGLVLPQLKMEFLGRVG